MTSADSCATVATFNLGFGRGGAAVRDAFWVKNIESLVKAFLMPELSNCSLAPLFNPPVDTVTSGLTKPQSFLSFSFICHFSFLQASVPCCVSSIFLSTCCHCLGPSHFLCVTFFFVWLSLSHTHTHTHTHKKNTHTHTRSE